PASRAGSQPWPTFPTLFKMESAHEELADGGGDRVYAVSTLGFAGDAEGNVRALRLVEVEGPQNGFKPIPGTEREIPADLVTLSMGFTGPEKSVLLEELGVAYDKRGNVARDASYMTSVEGVFSAGDIGRGQSLIVWAIAEGRAAASRVDAFLTGETALPYPILPTARSLV
ncbi:FAD-dependent oxidoreductase, partial [Nonomuraea sp. NPDC055795]